MQQLIVSRDLVFQGYANYNRNVIGDFMPDRVIFDEHFIFDCSEHDWSEGESYGGTIAWAAPHTETLTTGAVQYDEAELSHASTWTAAKNAAIEVRLQVDAIEHVAINAGFVDSTRHTATTDNQICFEFSGTALEASRCSNGVVFLFDTDGTGADVWYMTSEKSDQAVTPVAVLDVAAAAVAPEPDTYVRLKIALNASGDATYYYNGRAVGFREAAVTTTTALLPYVAVLGQAGPTARVLTVDRITCWQDDD